MNPVIVITGPTGAGKSALLYSLARETPIEVINMDSRQMYANMKIGTAMPQPHELERFPHHLFGFLSPKEKYSAGQFLRNAATAIENILERRRIPVLIGGTLFYLAALWDGLPPETQIPTALEREVLSLSDEELGRRLLAADPASSEKIPEGNRLRRERALLVSLASGSPFSRQEKQNGLWGRYRFFAFSMEPDRKELYRRINERTKAMFAAGLAEETDSLLTLGFGHSDPGLNTIGYAEIMEYLKTHYLRRAASLSPEAIASLRDTIAMNTRRYAKRQLTWTRNEPRIKIVDPPQAMQYLSVRLREAVSLLSTADS